MIKETQNFLLYNKANRCKLGLTDPLLLAHLPRHTKTLLDAGCGAGEIHSIILSEFVSLQKLIGFDVSEEMLETARKNTQDKRVAYLNMDATNIKLGQKFDSIMSIFLIQHLSISQVRTFFDVCKELLVPEGQLLILTTDTNAFARSPVNKKKFLYAIQAEGELKDGDKFKVILDKWTNIDSYFSPQFLQKQLNERGMKTVIQYIREENIKKNMFTNEEVQDIVSSKFIYIAKAKNAPNV